METPVVIILLLAISSLLQLLYTTVGNNKALKQRLKKYNKVHGKE